MKNLVQILLVVCLISIASANPSWTKYGPEYEKLTAQQKQASIWSEVVKDTTSAEWFSAASQARIFVESMDPTMNFVGDTFESGILGARNKYVHTVGSVAQIKFTPIPNSEGYTGLFQSGADYGIMRFSLAKQPDVTKTTAQGALDNFAPGFALKFLRDGIPSANAVALFSTNGQGSWNFFANKLSNHIPPGTGTAVQAIAKKFSSATPYVQTIGISDFAETNQNGSKVASPKSPFKLVFEPTEEVANLFPNDYDGTSFTSQLSTIKQGTNVYRVFAVENPGSQGVLIGQITTVSEITPSKFGDEYLFFKHWDMRKDLESHPEWKDKTPTFDCPFISVRRILNSFLE